VIGSGQNILRRGAVAWLLVLGLGFSLGWMLSRPAPEQRPGSARVAVVVPVPSKGVGAAHLETVEVSSPSTSTESEALSPARLADMAFKQPLDTWNALARSPSAEDPRLRLAVIEGWARRDPAGAAAFVGALPKSPDEDALIQAVLQRWWAIDPDPDRTVFNALFPNEAPITRPTLGQQQVDFEQPLSSHDTSYSNVP
jgi:hypothetical protein